jgi:hypothetical protein
MPCRNPNEFLCGNGLDVPFDNLEKVSDRARHYVTAALRHMLMWADYAAPFKFHPEQAVTLRPSYAWRPGGNRRPRDRIAARGAVSRFARRRSVVVDRSAPAG